MISLTCEPATNADAKLLRTPDREFRLGWGVQPLRKGTGLLIDHLRAVIDSFVWQCRLDEC